MPSHRTTSGSPSPSPTSVMKMTPNETNRIRSRYGKPSPFGSASGSASAAASETAPRTPVKAITNTCAPRRRRIALAQPPVQQPRQIGGGIDPGEARDDDDHGDQRGREQDIVERKRFRFLEQQPHLESGQQEQQALDQVDHEVPEEDALQPRRRGDQQRPVPADIEPAGHGGDHAGAAEMLRDPEGDVGRDQRQRDLDLRIARAMPHPQAEPADGGAEQQFADDDERRRCRSLSAAKTSRSKSPPPRSDTGSARWRRWPAPRPRGRRGSGAAARACGRSPAAPPRRAARRWRRAGSRRSTAARSDNASRWRPRRR